MIDASGQLSQQLAQAAAQAAYWAGRADALQSFQQLLGGEVIRGQKIQSTERAFGFARALKEGDAQ